MRAKVLLVTRHFWPHAAGRHERAAAAVWLCRRWSASGFTVEVVSPRYDTHGSTEFRLGDVRVHRVAAAPRGQWSNARYVRHLGTWLRDAAADFDAIVCDGLRDDVPAVAAAKGAADGSRKPLGIAIASGWGADGDVTWCRQAHAGARTLQAAMTLDAIVTEDPVTDRFLISQGVSAARLIRIPRGFARHQPSPSHPRTASVWNPLAAVPPADPPESQSPTRADRAAARHALAAVNADLVAETDAPVLLWCGPMTGQPSAEHGLGLLVHSAPTLLARYPDLKIWLLGDGPLRDWVHTELKAQGVRSAVAMPGSFVDMIDVLRSVDAVVQTDPVQLRGTIPLAIEHALPLIMVDDVTAHAWLNLGADDERTGCLSWYDPQTPASFRRAVRAVLDDLPAAARRAATLAGHFARTRPQATFVDRWVSLMQNPPTHPRRNANRPMPTDRSAE